MIRPFHLVLLAALLIAFWLTDPFSSSLPAVETPLVETPKAKKPKAKKKAKPPKAEA